MNYLSHGCHWFITFNSSWSHFPSHAWCWSDHWKFCFCTFKDPFLMGGSKLLVHGTKDKPTVIRTVSESRTIGCVCKCTCYLQAANFFFICESWRLFMNRHMWANKDCVRESYNESHAKLKLNYPAILKCKAMNWREYWHKF